MSCEQQVVTHVRRKEAKEWRTTVQLKVSDFLKTWVWRPMFTKHERLISEKRKEVICFYSKRSLQTMGGKNTGYHRNHLKNTKVTSLHPRN